MGELRPEVGEWNSFLSTWLFGAESFGDADVITAPAEIDVQLARGGHIDGVVTDPDGDSAPEVAIYIVSADDEFDQVTNDFTDDEGRFWAEVIPPGEYKVRFESEYGTQWATGRGSFHNADVIVVESGERVMLNEQLTGDPDPVEPGVISGTITTVGTGVPIAGACAITHPDEADADPIQACTDESGAYSLEIGPGLYEVRFMDPSGFHLEAEYDGGVEVGSGEETTGIDAELVPTGVILGTVLDSETSEPIEGICVNALDLSGHLIPLQDAACSDSSGIWKVSVADTEVVLLRAQHDVYAPLWYENAATIGDATAVSVTIGELTTVNDVYLSVAPAGGTVTGTVTNELGEPIEGACVRVTYVPNSRIGGCDEGSITDSSGIYVINDVPAGDQVFGVGKLWPHEYASIWNGGAPTRSAAEPINVASGSETTVDFVLPSQRRSQATSPCPMATSC